MKNIKYFIFAFISLFFNIFYVNAECTKEEINELKKFADDIKITYKHMGGVEKDYYIDYSTFEVTVKNITDDLYISLYNGTIELNPSNGEIKTILSNGTWNFNIYSKKCKKLVHTIEVFIPRFNEYSLDPLCEGVDGNDFALCGKYYEHDVNYESFKERVKNYRITHNVVSDNNGNKEGVSDNKIDVLLNSVVNFINQYKVYVIISLSIILMILIIIILIIKKKKRGVLE